MYKRQVLQAVDHYVPLLLREVQRFVGFVGEEGVAADVCLLYTSFLVSEHFIEGALRDSQRLRDLIHPDGTDAVPGDELLRDADDLLFGRP